jgi:putative transcription factor
MKFASDSSTKSDRSSSPNIRRPPVWAGGEDPRFPTAVRPPPKLVRKPPPKPRQSNAPTIDDLVLVEEYTSIIRAARQKANLTQEELAQRVGERVSTLQAIEVGRLKPIGKTLRGLERELGISLLESVGAAPLKGSKGAPYSGPTLGDVVKVKRKKSQKAPPDTPS